MQVAPQGGFIVHGDAIPMGGGETGIPLSPYRQSEYRICGKRITMDKAFPAWGRQRGGGFAAQKKANPASLRSAAPSKGRGSRGYSLLPMEGGAPKGRRLDGESGIPDTKPFPMGKTIKLSGRTFLAPHRGSSPKGLCKRTGFLGVKRRENPVRRHFERSEMRGLRSGIA